MCAITPNYTQMISHYLFLAARVIGIPQGMLVAIKISSTYGITVSVHFLLIATCSFVGLFVGYAEILLVKKIIGKN